MTKAQKRAERRYLIGEYLDQGYTSISEIIGLVENDEYEMFGFSLRRYSTL